MCFDMKRRNALRLLRPTGYGLRPLNETAARWLSTEAVVKPDGGNEAVLLYVDRGAADIVAVAPEIEVHGFALHRQVLRQAELGAPADCPAGAGLGIALRRASIQGHSRNRRPRTSVADHVSPILGDHRSGLYVRQEPIPIGVSDPRGRRG